MVDENTIVRERQKLIRREMDRRGIAIKAVQLDGGWKHPSTVTSYFPADGEADAQTMSVAALYRLLSRKALPSDLLSLLLPDGFAIVRVPEEVDHDLLCDAVQDYLLTKSAAHHPDSEAGRDIGPREHARLCSKATVLKAVAA